MIKWIKKHNVLVWVLSVVIAVMFWAYVAVVQDPEISMSISNITAVFGDEERLLRPLDLMILEGKDAVLQIRFTGRRSDLAKIKRENVILNVDLSSVRNAGPARCAYTVTLPPGLEGVKAEKLNDYVSIVVDSIRDKRVQIKLDNSDVTVAEGYLAEKETLTPEVLWLTGPSSVLDTISYAQVKVSKDDASKKIDQKADFTLHTDTGEQVRNQYITADAENVQVVIPIFMTKEVRFNNVFLDGGGLSASKNIICTFDPPYILLSGDPSILEPINNITLETIDLSKLVDSTTKIYDQIVLPNDVKNVGNLSSVTVTIEIVGVATRNVTAADISITGAHPPEGYTVITETKELTVTLRGPEDVLSMIQTHSVRIVADMTGMSQTPGYHRVPAKAFIDGYSSVGIVGSDFEIYVSIVPIADTLGDMP